MNIKQPIMAACIALILSIQGFAYAATPSAEEAVQTVERSLIELLDLLKETKLSSDTKVAEQEIHTLLEENLTKVIDFKSIVKRIMGKHFAGASKDQRNEFLAIFKISLIKSYGKFMLNTDINSLSETMQYQVLPTAKSRQDGRAQVTVVFKVAEKSYEAVHAMKYNPKRNIWLLENLVVEGINLGINYRSQFDRMMTRNKKDYKKVIEEWAGIDQQRLEDGKG